ncbi:MAG TPA: hypothetical protein VLK85_33865 [Ramlibacter sp.]|nr:hypothetical protein [Ramlibacter sp.]
MSGSSGFLALWNGVSDPAIRAEYEAWHTFEHVPERVGLPGFLWARRYAALPGRNEQPAYFTLYGLETIAALLSPQYQDVVDHPTPWSAHMRGFLSDFCREPCEAAAFYGTSSGARLATLQLQLQADEHAERLSPLLQALVDDGHAVRAGWGRVDRRSAHPMDGGDGEGHAGSDAVVLLEHIRDELLDKAADRLIEALPAGVVLRSRPAFFELQSAVLRADLTHPLSARQPPRADLRQHFETGDKRP